MGRVSSKVKPIEIGSVHDFDDEIYLNGDWVYYAGPLTVLGYTMYENATYYVCLTSDGDQADVHEVTLRNGG